MAQSTSQQRQAWAAYECKPHEMIEINFGPDRIRVAPPTADAWRALVQVMQAHGYRVRIDDTDSYNCREIKGGGGRSLHSYGIALDVNWNTNPFKLTSDNRAVHFSSKPTQEERAQDVKHGKADTDMTQAMIDDVLAIKTQNGKRVFEWGGNWQTRKDAMHFEIDVTPADLATGIDDSTVKKPDGGMDLEPGKGLLTEADDMGPLTIGARGDRVTALQNALQRNGFSDLRVDGDFGPRTQEAVRAFQSASRLPATGNADETTLQALGVLAPGPEPGIPGGISATHPDPVLHELLQTMRILLARQQAAQPVSGVPVAPVLPTQASPQSDDLLRRILPALLGRALPGGVAPPVLPAPNTSPTGTVPPVLSPIDKALGGEALAGKKTLLAIVAYVVTQLLTIKTGSPGAESSIINPNSTTHSVLTTLITAFGGLGVLGKVDRVIQVLGLIAAKSPGK